MAPTDTEDLTLATPERVTLKLPLAGVGHRVLAYLVDVSLMFFTWSAVYFACSLAVDVLGALRGLEGMGRALVAVGLFATQWASWTLCEVMLGGQTPGKRLLGIRVVRRDGAPVGWVDSALRNLVRVVDFLPAFYATGLLAMITGREARRLGDLVAGTVLVRTGRVDLSGYLALGPSSAGTDVSSGARLDTDELELLLHFRERRDWLSPTARGALALRLAALVARRLPSMPSPPSDALQAEALLEAQLGRERGT